MGIVIVILVIVVFASLYSLAACKLSWKSDQESEDYDKGHWLIIDGEVKDEEEDDEFDLFD